MTTDVRREVSPDDPRLEGLDRHAVAHATGEPAPPFGPSIYDPELDQRQRASDEAAMRAVEPRRPLMKPTAPALTMPEVRHARDLAGGVVTAAALTSLHRAIAAASHGLAVAKRKKIEKALADLHEALRS